MELSLKMLMVLATFTTLAHITYQNSPKSDYEVVCEQLLHVHMEDSAVAYMKVNKCVKVFERIKNYDVPSSCNALKEMQGEDTDTRNAIKLLKDVYYACPKQEPRRLSDAELVCERLTGEESNPSDQPPIMASCLGILQEISGKTQGPACRLIERAMDNDYTREAASLILSSGHFGC